MKIAEQVTFGAGQLDRADHIRADAAALAALKATGRILPVWRGKPLVLEEETGAVSLCYLSLNHPMIGAKADDLVFLGQDAQGALFAANLSDWTPEGDLPAGDSFFDDSRQTLPGAPAGSAFVELRGVMARLPAPEAEIAATARSILEWHRIHGFCANCGAPSVSDMAGWQRHCPRCERAHFPRTDPVVIMLITHGNSVLVGRGKGWPEGMYSLLAGFMEPGETIEAATRREVFEETGVRVGEVGYLASQPWPYPSSLMIGTYGRATSTQITLDENELEDAIWITREEMMDAFAGRHPFILPAREGAIAHFLLRNWVADCLD